MNVRKSVALIAFGLGVLATPAFAQEIPTFNAWGHEFHVPGARPGSVARAVPSGNDVLTTGSVNIPRAYTSGEADGVTPFAALPSADRTINVWGARLDAPRY